jgi:hypothetical protein
MCLRIAAAIVVSPEKIKWVCRFGVDSTRYRLDTALSKGEKKPASGQIFKAQKKSKKGVFQKND